ncbi:hypothetical protein [Pseudomonas sp. R84]|uniref:hypothetical protein n=1 Tax=Pseudomonas sp. R84 TaxID=1573712 RepID=UPI00135717EC|nr:hypothetical protein [Pseudomonas sp. R84]
MSPKSPIRGTTTVDVHPRPGSPRGGHVPHPTIPLSAGTLRMPETLTTGADLQAIRSAPSIRVSPSPPDPPIRPPAREPSLEHYLINAPASLPAPDGHGVRTFKGRRYVDVPDGGIVQVVTDAPSGLYRARLASELTPAGPLLIRDRESGLWHPLEDGKSITFPLSDTRLQDFATDLDFTGVQVGRDRLYRYGGKLYAVIAEQSYQALHDLDASSPALPVMRIVRPEDPVASDPANVYIGTRAGRSEPIVFDEQRGWVGTLVGGTAGMRRRANPADALRAADLTFELQTLELQFNQAMTTGEQLHYRWQALKGSEAERAHLQRLEEHHRWELSILEKTLDLHTDEKERIVSIMGRVAYREKIIVLHKGRMLTYNQLMIASDSRKLLDGPIFGGPVADHAAVAAHLSNKLEILKKRQDIADELLNKWRLSPDDLKGTVYDPIDLHENVAFWIYAKSRLFVDEDAPVDISNANARYLAFCFGEVTFAFRALKEIPQHARISVLSDLLDQTSAVKASYENLPLPPGPQHAGSRSEIIEAIEHFEHTLEQHLDRYHQEQDTTAALPPHEQPIDFDFIPAQGQSPQAAAPRKMFRSKHHGVYKIRVGRPRRTAAGEDLIDVMNPHDPTEVLQTYERREGEWRRQMARQERNLSTLTAQARQHLEQSEAHLHTAWRDEKAKRNASGIVEFLTGRADELDDLARQIGQAPNPAASDISALVQRLHHDSQRLLQEGENIRVRLYKDPDYLSNDRVAYLIRHGHLSATRTQSRIPLGKGNKKEFLDVYTLNDSQAGTVLWYAHFHYTQKDSPLADFQVKRGHLKTRQQNRLGTSSQRRDEQAGRAHVKIWREDIDSRTAQRIFELAS